MRWLPGPHQKIFSLTKKITDFIEIKIKEHSENLDPSSPRDYIDSFLIEMKEVIVVFCFCFVGSLCTCNEVCGCILTSALSVF